jgi:hypothetical protein
MIDTKKLISELDDTDLFLRNRAKAAPAPLNEYDIMLLQDAAKACDGAARALEKSVVPPVDIGDKVWYIEGGYYNASYMRPVEIEVTEINKKKADKSIEWGFIANCTRYKFSSLGKTVFWTKAECEAAIEKKKKSSRRFT